MDVVVEKLNNIPLLEVIDKWWGTRYCMGGATDNCLDCSGFTQILMRDVYKQMIPRTSQDQYNACEKIDLEEMREGDLVFFNTGGKDISHVGIYLLNNKIQHGPDDDAGHHTKAAGVDSEDLFSKQARA